VKNGERSEAAPKAAEDAKETPATSEPTTPATPEPATPEPSADAGPPPVAAEDTATPIEEAKSQTPKESEAAPPTSAETPPRTSREIAAEPGADEAAGHLAGEAAAPLALATEEAQPAAEPRRPRVWPWIAAALLGVAVVGGAVGATLGSRQGGPLSSQGPAGARPTIVVATVAAVASASRAATPTPTAVAPTAVVAVQPPGGSEYVVQSGDTLRSIAEHQYGDATQWPRIYNANRDLIGPDPDALKAGMRLQLPD
jgi:nucleoid-associated protein YgaU